MSLPYFPMFPKDFEAKTSHLTLEEDGAYNRLLRIMWMSPGCSIPADAEWIRRRMRVDADTYDRVVKVVIDEFCVSRKGRVFQDHLLAIYEETNEKHAKRVEAGSRGGKAKSRKTKETAPSNAVAKPKQPEPEPEPEPDKEREPNGSLSSGDDQLDLIPVHVDEISRAVEAYNEAANHAGWPKVQKIGKARRSALSARLKDAGGIDGWVFALDKAKASPHLTGQNDRGWTASFDFLTRESSFVKLMEGNYDARPVNGSGPRINGRREHDAVDRYEAEKDDIFRAIKRRMDEGKIG